MLRQFITLAALVTLCATPVLAEDTAATDESSITEPVESEAAATVEDSQAELLFWESIRDSDNEDLFVAYLSNFPDGLFRVIAEEKLKEIYARQGEESGEETSAEAPSPKPQATAPSLRRIKIGLQRQLRRVGCYKGPIDGIWGPQSVRALIRYNQSMGTKFRPRYPTERAWKAVLKTRRRVCW
jgi:hypothetical protein